LHQQFSDLHCMSLNIRNYHDRTVDITDDSDEKSECCETVCNGTMSKNNSSKNLSKCEGEKLSLFNRKSGMMKLKKW